MKNKAFYGWLVCFFAAIFYCFEYLLRIEPSVMVPELMHRFSITAGSLGLLSAMYYCAYTPMQITVGVLIDYYGPKRILTLAIICCVLGLLIFGHTHVFLFAAIGRFLIGFGSAFAFVGVLKLAAMWLPANRFAFFAGLTTSLGMLGAMFGDVELSWAVQKSGVQSILWASELFGLLLIPIFMLIVKDKTHAPCQNKRTTLQKAFKGFIRLLCQRQILLSGLVGCMLYLSLSVFGEMWGIPYLSKSHPNWSGVTVGAVNAMVFAGWFVGGPLFGWLSDHVGSRRRFIMLGGILAALSLAIILVVPISSSYLLGGVLFLFGLFASAEILCFALGRDFVSLHQVASAVGAINFLVMLSGMFLQPLVGYILDLSWQGHYANGIRVYNLIDYQHALWMLPVFMLLASVFAFFLQEKSSKPYA